MKKWYVITGILVLLLLVSMVTCSGNSAQLETELDKAIEKDVWYSDVTQGLVTELSSTKTQLAETKTNLEKARAEKATEEISFGNGLKVFDIEKGWSEVSGNVQNISTLPMKLVYVIVAAYDKDGTLKDVSSTRVHNLYPNEVAEWEVWSESTDIYTVYALGNLSYYNP